MERERESVCVLVRMVGNGEWLRIALPNISTDIRTELNRMNKD